MSCPLVITSTPLFARQTAVTTVSISSGSITSGLITAPVPTSPGQADSRPADFTQRNRPSPLSGTSSPRIAPVEPRRDPGGSRPNLRRVSPNARDTDETGDRTWRSASPRRQSRRPRMLWGDDPATPESAVPGVATPDSTEAPGQRRPHTRHRPCARPPGRGPEFPCPDAWPGADRQDARLPDRDEARNVAGIT